MSCISRPVAGGDSGSSDEGQTTDGEAESDRESSRGGGGAWWGGLDDDGRAEVAAGASSSASTAERIEARKQRAGRTERLRRSMSSLPVKPRVRVDCPKLKKSGPFRLERCVDTYFVHICVCASQLLHTSRFGGGLAYSLPTSLPL